MNPSYTTTGELPANPYPSGPSLNIPQGETLIHAMQGDLVNGEFQPNMAAGAAVFFKWKENYYGTTLEHFTANTK